MKLSQSSLSLLEETIKKAISRYTCGCEQTIVTDIHLQPNQNSGELAIFDDEDEELANVTIEEWTAYEGDDFYETYSPDPTLQHEECRHVRQTDHLETILVCLGR